MKYGLNIVRSVTDDQPACPASINKKSIKMSLIKSNSASKSSPKLHKRLIYPSFSFLS